MRLKGSLFAVSAFVLLASAQGAYAADDAQVWTAIAAAGRVSGDVIWAFDANTRFYDNASYLAHAQVRGLIGLEVAPKVAIGLGYSYVRNENAAGRVTHENRVFQQGTYALFNAGTVKFSGRTRLEQRWFSNVDGVTWRFRQQLKMAIPLEGPKGLQAVVHSEAFFLLNDPSHRAPKGINQVRTFAGLDIPLARDLRLEAGYLNQTLTYTNRTNHVLSMGLGAKF